MACVFSYFFTLGQNTNQSLVDMRTAVKEEWDPLLCYTEEAMS